MGTIWTVVFFACIDCGIRVNYVVAKIKKSGRKDFSLVVWLGHHHGLSTHFRMAYNLLKEATTSHHFEKGVN